MRTALRLSILLLVSTSLAHAQSSKLSLQPIGSWAISGSGIGPACDSPVSPAQTNWAGVAGQGVTLSVVGTSVACCDCIRRSAVFAVGATNVTGAHLNGVFTGMNTGTYADGTFRVIVLSGTTIVGKKVLATQQRANNNCASSDEEPETVVDSGGSFDLDLSSINTNGASSFDTIEIEMLGYACSDGTSTTAAATAQLANLVLVSPSATGATFMPMPTPGVTPPWTSDPSGTVIVTAFPDAGTTASKSSSGCAYAPGSSSGGVVLIVLVALVALRRRVLLAIVLAACGGGAATRSQVIGAAGGSLTLDGVTVTIPAGALDTPTSITLSDDGTTPDARYDVSGKVYKLQPAKLSLKLAATVSVPYGGSDAKAAVFLATPQGHGYRRLPSTSASGALSGKIRYLDDVFVGNAASGSTVAFAAPKSSSTAGTVDAHVTGDFNGDHIPDVALLHAQAGAVELMINDGTGAFTSTTVPVVLGTTPTIAAADLDVDGIDDVIAVSVGSGGSLRTQLISASVAAPLHEDVLASALTAIDNVVTFGSGDPIALGDGDLHRGFLVAAQQGTHGDVILVTSAGTATTSSSAFMTLDVPTFGQGPWQIYEGVTNDARPRVSSLFGSEPIFNGFDEAGTNMVVHGTRIDLDGASHLDPLADLDVSGVVLDVASCASAPNDAYVMLGDGTVSDVHLTNDTPTVLHFPTPVATPPVTSAHLTVADFGSEGDRDVVVADAIGLAHFTIDSGGHLRMGADVMPGALVDLAPLADDFDGDGNADLLTELAHDQLALYATIIQLATMPTSDMATGVDAVVDFKSGTPPTITSFSPTGALAGTGSPETGTAVTIVGDHFHLVGDPDPIVMFHGSTTAAYVDDNHNDNPDTVHMIIVFPPPDATDGPITVTTPYGTTTSEDPILITHDSTCGETGISPSMGTGTVQVTITGQGFAFMKELDYTTDADPSAPASIAYTRVDDHHLSVSLTGSQTGTFSAVGPGYCEFGAFVFYRPPTITSLDISPALPSINYSFTITGTNLKRTTGLTVGTKSFDDSASGCSSNQCYTIVSDTTITGMDSTGTSNAGGSTVLVTPGGSVTY